MAPIYLGKRVVPSSLRYIENLALYKGKAACSVCAVLTKKQVCRCGPLTSCGLFVRRGWSQSGQDASRMRDTKDSEMRNSGESDSGNIGVYCD